MWINHWLHWFCEEISSKSCCNVISGLRVNTKIDLRPFLLPVILHLTYLIFSFHSFSVSFLFSEDVVHQICGSMGGSVNNSVDGVQKEFLKK